MPHTFDAFRHRSFRLLWPANFFGYISRWMQMTLLVWFVLEITESPFYVALVGFFGMAPLLLFGAFGGVLADRLNKLKLLLTTQVINLLEDLRDEFGLTYLFISHDLSVIRHLCQRVAVMYLGHIVEIAPSRELFKNPRHSYTKALLSSIPSIDPFFTLSEITEI